MFFSPDPLIFGLTFAVAVCSPWIPPRTDPPLPCRSPPLPAWGCVSLAPERPGGRELFGLSDCCSLWPSLYVSSSRFPLPSTVYSLSPFLIDRPFLLSVREQWGPGARSLAPRRSRHDILSNYMVRFPDLCFFTSKERRLVTRSLRFTLVILFW